MAGLLEGCFRKVERSQEHLKTLNERVYGFFEEDLDGIYRLHGETNSQRTKCLFRAEILREIPVLGWGIIVGDAVHCLRSALDQLVYEISEDPENTAYPVCLGRKEWVINSPACTWGVPESLIALIDQAQPYHRGDKAKASAHPLAVLSALSNCDKHRHIPVTALIPESAEATVTSTQGIKTHGSFVLKTGRPLEHGAVVAETSIVPDDSGLEPQMQMHGGITLTVGFGKTGVPSSIAGKPVPEVFAQLGQFVNDTLRTVGEAWVAYLGQRALPAPE